MDGNIPNDAEEGPDARLNHPDVLDQGDSDEEGEMEEEEEA